MITDAILRSQHQRLSEPKYSDRKIMLLLLLTFDLPKESKQMQRKDCFAEMLQKSKKTHHHHHHHHHVLLLLLLLLFFLLLTYKYILITNAAAVHDDD